MTNSINDSTSSQLPESLNLYQGPIFLNRPLTQLATTSFSLQHQENNPGNLKLLSIKKLRCKIWTEEENKILINLLADKYGKYSISSFPKQIFRCIQWLNSEDFNSASYLPPLRGCWKELFLDFQQLAHSDKTPGVIKEKIINMFSRYPDTPFEELIQAKCKVKSPSLLTRSSWSQQETNALVNLLNSQYKNLSFQDFS